MTKSATRPAGRTASARNAVGSTRRSTRTRVRHAGRPFPLTRREAPAFGNRHSRSGWRVSHLPEPAWEQSGCAAFPGSEPAACRRETRLPSGHRAAGTANALGISGPSTQRWGAATSTTSRLSHPVSSRLAARLHRAPIVLHALLQDAKRKGPSPWRKRALSCGN